VTTAVCLWLLVYPKSRMTSTRPEAPELSASILSSVEDIVIINIHGVCRLKEDKKTARRGILNVRIPEVVKTSRGVHTHVDQWISMTFP